jgi:glucuronokinase
MKQSYGAGGTKLLQATCKTFFSLCQRNFINLEEKRGGKGNGKGFIMTFSTTIPRMVGLSGSSAIIVAAFKGLLRFYRLTIKDLNIDKTGKLPFSFQAFHKFSNL